jgi:DNA-binding MarR family transcriptional regulator
MRIHIWKMRHSAAFTNYYNRIADSFQMLSGRVLTIHCHNDYSRLMSPSLRVELKQKAPFTSREQEAYLSLLRTADAVQTMVENKLKEFGLTGTQYNALRILRGAGPGGLPCREIGERMIAHDPDITRLLNRLENRGFVERKRARDDRRVIYGKITDAGLTILHRMDGPVDKHVREMLRHVGREKLKQLIEVLDLVRGS